MPRNANKIVKKGKKVVQQEVLHYVLFLQQNYTTGSSEMQWIQKSDLWCFTASPYLQTNISFPPLKVVIEELRGKKNKTALLSSSCIVITQLSVLYKQPTSQPAYKLSRLELLALSLRAHTGTRASVTCFWPDNRLITVCNVFQALSFDMFGKNKRKGYEAVSSYYLEVKDASISLLETLSVRNHSVEEMVI